LVSVVAWLVATVASILLATAAVGNVGSWGEDRPAPLQATASSLVTLAPPGSTTVVEPPPSTTVQPTTTVARSTTCTTVTTQPDTSTTPSTTQAPATTQSPTTSTTSTSTTTTTTTTAAPSEEFFESRQLIGGWVQLRISGDNVYLEAAVPESGFTVDVEHNGPEKVEVEFKSESHDSKLTARVDSGELDIRTEEEDEDD